ncbi:MAG: VanZ family protein [Acidimicrobiia bacterium]|nr:VanZ family protein [Acidimicrobiia bacterium]
MTTTLRNWWRNASDALDLMWTEPLSWLVLIGAALWIALAYRRDGRLNMMKTVAIAGLGVWLVAAFAITIYPIELEAPRADRFEVKSIVPLWGTIEAIADADGYWMDEDDWMRQRQAIADERGVPVESVNLDRKVHGPGLSVVLKDPIGNTVLFLPLGFLAAFGWQHMRDPKRILMAGAAVSGGIELSQLLFGLGSLGTIDDVIFNTLGALFGWVGWRVSVDAAASIRRQAIW